MQLNLSWFSSPGFHPATCRGWGFTLHAALILLGTVAGATLSMAGESDFLTQTRQLTFEGRRAGEGYFAPDGKSLVFQSERTPDNPFYQIYTLNLESGDSRRISPGFGKTTCAFIRPGTSEIQFASTHLDPAAREKQKAELEFRASGKQRRYSWDYDDQMDIFVAAPDGSSIRRLTDAPGYDAEGSCSPDGKWIVFCSLRDAYPTNRLDADKLRLLEADPAYFGEIYLMEADGSNQRRLTSTPGYDGGPFFSPDGERILWRRFDEKGTTADIYTMRRDGSDVQRLTDFGAMSWAPYFHPSGDYVIFTANKLGFANFELFLVDAAGAKEPVRVTWTDGFDGLPVFAPDGARLCWTSSRTSEGQSQLFMAKWNDTAARRALAEAPGRNAQTESDATSGSARPIEAAAASAAGSKELSPEIREDDLRSQVGFLSSEALEGRMTGFDGTRKAAEYLARYLESNGLSPVGSNWFQDFEFTSGTRLVPGANRLQVRDQTLTVEKDFGPLAFSANGTVTGAVVFAGYGLCLPDKTGNTYDSYAGLDVSNKIVLALRYVPEGVPSERRQELNRYAGLRYKAMLARHRGARGILFVTGPTSPEPGALVPLSSDTALSGSGILAMSISDRVAEALLAGSGRDLKTLQEGLDNENPHAESSLDLTNVQVSLTVDLERVRKTDRNVLGWIPPRGGSREIVMLGAHYDHLGRGEDSGAFNRKGEEGLICHGADDNASGVALLMELAGAIAKESRDQVGDRGVLFAFWSGEEMGLLGSAHFANHPPVSLSNVVAYLNFDMVGRMRTNRLILQGVGSSTAWRRMIEKRNVAAGFDVVLQEDPYLPTDTTSFYPKRVPVLAFFTGSHDDYHRPTDTAEKLDYEGLARITRFASGLLSDLRKPENNVDYVEVTQTSGDTGSRETLRAYLGTIPDYASQVEGVKLSGVRGGSPADQAGLRGGDTIVEFGGRKIANIYDYTYGLDAVKIGQSVEIVVVREGQRVTLSVTPVARK